MSTEAVEFDMKKGEEVNVNMGLEMSKRKLKKLRKGKVEKERKTVHCIHWLKDKKRYCRLQRMKEFNLCAEHLPMDPCGRDELSCGRVRVKCPYPPNQLSHSFIGILYLLYNNNSLINEFFFIFQYLLRISIEIAHGTM